MPEPTSSPSTARAAISGTRSERTSGVRREVVVGVRMTVAERAEMRRIAALLSTDLSGLLRRPWFPWEAS